MKPYDAEAELTMLKALRRDFHAHPELGFEEERTSAIVREKLLGAGIEVVGGLGKTGLVGTLKIGDGVVNARIGVDNDLAKMHLGQRRDVSGNAIINRLYSTTFEFDARP